MSTDLIRFVFQSSIRGTNFRDTRPVDHILHIDACFALAGSTKRNFCDAMDMSSADSAQTVAGHYRARSAASFERPREVRGHLGGRWAYQLQQILRLAVRARGTTALAQVRRHEWALPDRQPAQSCATPCRSHVEPPAPPARCGCEAVAVDVCCGALQCEGKTGLLVIGSFHGCAAKPDQVWTTGASMPLVITDDRYPLLTSRPVCLRCAMTV